MLIAKVALFFLFCLSEWSYERVHGSLIYVRTVKTTFDEIKFYIQLVIVQLVVHFQARVKCSA